MPVSRLRVVMTRTLVLALFWLGAGPLRAQDAGWLYLVDVPVADQSPGARQQGARVALSVVLSRLTGLPRPADEPRVRAALGSPDRYYNRFGYAAGALPGETLLRVQFSPPALFELIRSAGLPIWPSARPVIRAWLVVDQGPVPHLAQTVADAALLDAFSKRALERGLQLRIGFGDAAELQPEAAGAAGLPAIPGGAGSAVGGAAGAATAVAMGAPGLEPSVPDLVAGEEAIVDPLAVTREPEAVMLRPAILPGDPVWPTLGLWDAPAAEVAAMVQGDPGELPLVARIGVASGGAWAARWEVVETPPPGITAASDAAPTDAAPTGIAAETVATAAAPTGEDRAAVDAQAVAPPEPLVFEARAASAEALAASLVDGLVDHLLGRYQVQAGSSQVVTIAVDGLDGAAAYAKVLDLFGGVEVIDDVAVVAAEGERIWFALTTMAALEQVATLMTAGGRLVPEPAAPIAGDASLLPPGADLVLRWQGP